jgi:hypothetical protein
MLNIAGPEYDYAQVVFAVLQECEHRRRSFDDDEFESRTLECAREKLASVKKAYDEFSGSATYWDGLQKEVMSVVVPQYIVSAREITQRERRGFGVWRNGDVLARAVFALIGLTIGGIIIELPFIPIFERMFAFALTFLGFIYPELVRFMYERRHTRALNRLITTSAKYQENARIQYMTTDEITRALAPGEPKRID